MPTNKRLRPGDPDNFEPRCAVVLVLDVSGSMSGDLIRELNSSLKALKEDLLKNEVASLRVEVAVVRFGGTGGTVSLVHDFAMADEFNPPMFIVSVNALMGEAIEYALQLVIEREEEYKKHGIRYYRSNIFLITNSYPNSDLTCQEALQKMHQADKDGNISFCVLGVKGMDKDQLKQLTPPNHLQMYLEGFEFLRYIERTIEDIQEEFMFIDF